MHWELINHFDRNFRAEGNEPWERLSNFEKVQDVNLLIWEGNR